MPVIDVAMKDLPLKIQCEDQHDWFWKRINDNEWEMDTLQAFDQYIDEKTLYIDIGAWIGPTVLYGGSRAKRVVAVEPDPIAMSALIRNLECNPTIGDKVTLHSHAIDAKGGRLDLWAHQFGDSMTSVLPSRGARCVTFLKMGIEEFLDGALAGGNETHVFIKIDVEGGEYTLVPALCESLMRRNIQAYLYLSLHASFLLRDRDPKSYTTSLLKNAVLLDAITRYGMVYTHIDGEWQSVETDFGNSAFLDFIRTTGGPDTTLLIKAGS